MTGKERAELRKQANTIPAIFQIGKEGLSGNLLSGVDNALKKRELVKITVLESCEEDVKSVSSRMAEALEAECIQCIGRKLVLYRQKPDDEQ